MDKHDLIPKKIDGDYNAEQISILEGLQAVRKRPGMYIGSTSETGLHHLVREIVDNGVDEAMAGECTEINCIIEPDNSITIKDNGRGIPVDIHPKTGTSTLEVVYTVLHAGGKFGQGGYKTSGGLHGVGASVVNALSEKLSVHVTRVGDVNEWGMSCERGIVTESTHKINVVDVNDHWTKVHFKPDPEIFSTTIYDYDILKTRLRELAFLNKGLKLTLEDKRVGHEKSDEFCYKGGLLEYVAYLNNGKPSLYEDVIYMSGESGTTQVELAFQHNQEYGEKVIGYVNSIHTPDGGTHVAGFRNALTRTLNTYARNNGLFKKKDMTLSSEDLKEGLSAVINVKIENPEFEGQTKQKLGNSEVKGAVEKVINEQLMIYFELHPDGAKSICEKAVLAQQAREAARKAREQTRRKTAMESNSLPGKLADCSSKNADECEIFIVEGNSAGGSAKDARDRKTQAVLGLKGKILNVLKANEKQIHANTEIETMIRAFGTGIGEDFNIDKLRYDKIIIASDADVDGEHIVTLFLTFMYKFMPQLIKTGHVYLAKPPLYKLTRNKKDYYVYTENELLALRKKLGHSSKDSLQRYKGYKLSSPYLLFL